MLVVVLSGCSSEPTHYFKCDAIKEHKDRYYTYYNVHLFIKCHGYYLYWWFI